MASITIDNLDDQLQDSLREQAAEHGRSVEEEARMILHTAFARQFQDAGHGQKPQSRQGAGSQQSGHEDQNLALLIHNLFADIGGVEPGELKFPPRSPGREPPRFE